MGQFWPPQPRPVEVDVVDEPTSIANGAVLNYVVSFPAGVFSTPPRVITGVSHDRLTSRADMVTASGFRLSVANRSGAGAGGPHMFTWVAYAV